MSQEPGHTSCSIAADAPAILIDAPASLNSRRNAKPTLDAAKLQKRLPKRSSAAFGLVRLE